MKLKILMTFVFFLLLCIGLQYGIPPYGYEDKTAKSSEWEQAAKKGDATAQFRLGEMYHSGEGVSKDYKKALHWYEKAAKQGYANAQYNLGGMYHLGHGVSQDYKKSFHWHEKAAKQGDATAQLILGGMYHLGRGVPKDYKKSFHWYEKAAKQDHKGAQFVLGEMYHHGRGVPKDYIQAYVFLNLALSGSIIEVKRKLINEFISLLEKKMTPTQIAKAQKLFSEFKSAIPTEPISRSHATDQ